MKKMVRQTSKKKNANFHLKKHDRICFWSSFVDPLFMIVEFEAYTQCVSHMESPSTGCFAH